MVYLQSLGLSLLRYQPFLSARTATAARRVLRKVTLLGKMEDVDWDDNGVSFVIDDVVKLMI